MAYWYTIDFSHSDPEKVVEKAKELFEHHPGNTSIRAYRGRVQACTRKEEDKLKEVIKRFLESDQVAAFCYINNTVESGNGKAFTRKDGEIVKLDEYTEPEGAFGDQLKNEFCQDYGFTPNVSEFRAETYHCFKCREVLKVEEGDTHTHDVTSSHSDHNHESDTFKIRQNLEFKMDKLEPDPVIKTQVYNIEDDEVVKEYEDRGSALMRNGIAKANEFIEAVETEV